MPKANLNNRWYAILVEGKHFYSDDAEKAPWLYSTKKRAQEVIQWNEIANAKVVRVTLSLEKGK